MEIDVPLTMRAKNNIPFNIVFSEGAEAAAIIAIKELSQCIVKFSNNGGTALNLYSGFKAIYPQSDNSSYNSCQFIPMNDTSEMYIDGIYDLDGESNIIGPATDIYFNGCDFRSISDDNDHPGLILNTGAIDRHDVYFESCIFHSLFGTSIKGIRIIPHYTYSHFTKNLFINISYEDAIEYWYDLSHLHTNRLITNIGNVWNSKDIPNYPTATNPDSKKLFYENFNRFILKELRDGNAPYTGYNFGMYSSFRSGIGALNFNKAPANVKNIKNSDMDSDGKIDPNITFTFEKI